MRIAVSGSIAADYLMTFPGRFVDLLVEDQLDRLSLSFLADRLEIRRGGAGANIAFGLGQLGVGPLLVGAVGMDFRDDYGPWLRRHGVETSAVLVSRDQHTARFLCTTDTAESQIATFYPGAMSESRSIRLAPLHQRVGGIDLLVVAPNDPEAMLCHTAEALELGIGVVADPSQQLARLEGPEIRQLLDGARYLVANDYERALYERKTGWSADEVLRRVGTVVTTHGAEGVTVQRAGEPAIHVPAVPPSPVAVIEPTGAGDAFRAGFLAGVALGLDLEHSTQLGCAVATQALETVGPQEYRAEPRAIGRRLASAYGRDAADVVLAHLTEHREARSERGPQDR